MSIFQEVYIQEATSFVEKGTKRKNGMGKARPGQAWGKCRFYTLEAYYNFD